MDRQQRKGYALLAAHKARNRNSLLLQLWKQLNGIPPVTRDLPIAIKIATDRTHTSYVGKEINLVGQKRFCVFPNGFECVNVR